MNEMVENHVKFDYITNLSKKEKNCIYKTEIYVINDTDKKIWDQQMIRNQRM